jgi:hypothetical protein
LSLGVPEHDVPALWLEVPRSDKDGISHLDPDAALHFSANSTNSGYAVGTFYQYPVVTKEVLDGPVELAWTGRKHLAEVGLAEDFSLSHTINILEYGGNIKGQNSDRYWGDVLVFPLYRATERPCLLNRRLVTYENRVQCVSEVFGFH